MLKPKKGRLLISEPSYNDSDFFKSIVLLTHHDHYESIGLILNKSSETYLNEIFNDIKISGIPIYIGGPVSRNTLQFIHTLGNIIPETKEIYKGLYWGGDWDIVKSLINKNIINKNSMRFFAGYSGWSENQLNDEIKEKLWLVSACNKEVCMKHSSDLLWNQIVRLQDSPYKIWSNLPSNPNLN